MAKVHKHTGRHGDEEGNTVCTCGQKFEDDATWYAHYVENTTEAERCEIENRPLPEEEDQEDGA